MTFQELGNILRIQREALHLSLADVASKLKMGVRVLRGIEEGDLSALPHTVYTKSFIRSYARMLGLDVAEISRELDSIFPPEIHEEAKPESMSTLSYFGKRRVPLKGIAVLAAIVVILAAIGSAAWFVVSRYGDDIADLVRKPFSARTEDGIANETIYPDNLAADAGDASASTADIPTHSAIEATSRNHVQGNILATGDSNAASLISISRPDSPDVHEERTSDAVMPASSQRLAANNAEDPLAAAVSDSSPAADSSIQSATVVGDKAVHLSASGECWVEVKADGASRGYSFTIYPGQNRSLPFNSSMEIVLGNAGGVTITHGDTIFSPAGSSGERKVLRFSAER